MCSFFLLLTASSFNIFLSLLVSLAPCISAMEKPSQSLSSLISFSLISSVWLSLSQGIATAAAAAAAPAPVNITQIMEGAGQFGTFLSLLSATNVGQLFQAQANKTTTGITIFAPTDKAFSSMEAGIISRLTAQEKIILMEFHALSAFYPLAALQQATDPVTPTIATDSIGVGKYTVNVTNQQGTVVISTGLTNAALISTLYNAVPCGVFAINQVLLPEEIFGLPTAPSPSPSPSLSPSPLPSSFSPPLVSISSSPASPFGPAIPSSSSSHPSLPSSPLSSDLSFSSPPPLFSFPFAFLSSLVIALLFNYFLL